MIDPVSGSSSALGPEFQIGGLASGPSSPATGSSSFGGILSDKVGALNDLQNKAADQSQALATGQATDVASVVTTVEQAALAMQLAVQVRNKAVEAYQELMRMQV
ncbi:MAG: flagellar hook-basal body complex protein FliE [Gaiellales bacterium]|nr:flagellar hook-basal body complex protein FliE [Gaiellales bacterium]